MKLEIREVGAEGEAGVADVRRLFLEYADFLGVDLCFQGFEQELAELPGAYTSPEGWLLLAIADSTPAGCVALRKLDDGVCEMKRLYVQPGFRGLGLGRQLAEAIIQEARGIGYHRMRLDSLASLQEATALYRSLGFVEIPAYRFNPLSDVVFMELVL